MRFEEEITGAETARATVMAELAGSILDQGRRVTFEVQGDSMVPTLRSGDHVTIAPAGERPLRPGCLVAWRSGDGVVVHRLVQMLPDGSILTAGDAVDHRDDPAGFDSLLGVVIGVDRNGRWFEPLSGRLVLTYREILRVPVWLKRRVRRLFR